MSLSKTYGQSSLGDNIFLEDFGQATTGVDGNSTLWDGVYFKKTPLPYISSLLFYNPSDPPNEYGPNPEDNWGPRYISNWPLAIGGYSIITDSRGYNNPYFHSGPDHTGNERGFMLLVDANASTGLYFDREIEGLCAGTNFQFSVWVKDINAEGEIPPSVTFNIYDADTYVDEHSTEGLLETYTSSADDVAPVNQWNEVKMSFTMPPGVDRIKLQIRNAVAQEIGNDLVIDDITLRPIGPPILFAIDPGSPICVGSDITYRARVLENPYPVNHFLLQKRKINPEGNDPLGDDFENVDGMVMTTGTEEAVFRLDAVTAGDDNYEYRVIVAGDPSTLANKTCRVASEPIELRVYHHEPTISFDGASALCAGESTVLSATVTGSVVEDPDYFFKWETSVNQTDWSVIAGQTGAALNTGELVETAYYRVTAYVGGEGGCPGNGTSDVFEVPVNPLPEKPVADDIVACIANDLSIEIAGYSTSDHAYTFEKQVDGMWTVAEGFDFSDGVFVKPDATLADAGIYRIVVQNENGCREISDDIAITVHTLTSITTQPVTPDAFCLGSTAELTVAATGEGTLTYEWFRKDIAGDISVGTGPAYETPSDLPAGTHVYYVIVKGSESCNEATSEEVTITVNAAEAGNISGDQTVCLGTMPETIVSVAGGSGEGTITYRWESSTDEQQWHIIPGATGETYAIPVLDQSTFFRRVVSSSIEGNQCEAYSNVVAITVNTDCGVISEKSVADADGDGLAQAGEQLTYTIAVNSTYDRDITVNIADQIPAHTVYVSTDASGNYSSIDNEITWNNLVIPAGGGITVSFIVEVVENLTGISNIENTAVVTSDVIEIPQTPKIVIDTDPAKSFESAKTADKADVKAGDELTYTIRVTNTGDVDYNGITIEDAIPANTVYREGSASPAATLTDNTLSWTVDVPFGESRGVSFTVVVDEDLTGVETIRNVATVTGDDPETPEEPEVETPTDPAKSFESAKTADKADVKAGDELTYTIRVTNTGDVDYNGITIEDAIPANTVYREGSASPAATLTDNTLSWTVDVPFGESREVSFTVVVDEDLTGVETIRNVATVTGDDPENPERPDTETEVIPEQRFGSVKTVSDATGDGNAQAGEELTYTITVKNTGNRDYDGITIEDVIPDHTVYVAGSATGNGMFNNGKLTWTVDVPYGDEISVSFNVQVAETLDGVTAIRNIATVTGGNPENPDVEHPESPEVPVITGPIANDDQGSTDQGESVNIAVLANDKAGSSAIVPGSMRLVDPTTGDEVTTVTIEGEGTYTVAPDGTVNFTPEANFVGVSTAQYTVKDENGLKSNEATISVTVEGVAAEIAPNAVDDQATTQYGQPVTIAVLNNDQIGSSPIVPATVRLIDESGNRVSTVTIPGEGRYEVNTQGVVTFTPADGFTGTSTIRYEVSDENGLVSNTANISVTVGARSFKIPNVFTPNGDGRNDVFEIVGIEGFDRVEITVVNRWGNEVYRNNNYRNNWDGQGLNEGTYYYVIITHDGAGRERHAGWVLIKRQ